MAPTVREESGKQLFHFFVWTCTCLCPFTVMAMIDAIIYWDVDCSTSTTIHISRWLLGFAVSTSIVTMFILLNMLVYAIAVRFEVSWEGFGKYMLSSFILWGFYCFLFFSGQYLGELLYSVIVKTVSKRNWHSGYSHARCLLCL